MTYLLDTNIISEIRKGPDCHPNVRAWVTSISDEIWHDAVNRRRRGQPHGWGFGRHSLGGEWALISLAAAIGRLFSANESH